MNQNEFKKAVVGSRSAVVVHIITGDGQGKTTASLGLALRAIGANKTVVIIQFMKKGDSSEIKAIKKYKLPIEVERFGIGFYKILGDKHTAAEHKKACERGLAAAKKAIESQKYDVIILDEINVALGFKLLDIQNVIDILKFEPKLHLRGGCGTVDIILTGRKAPVKLKNLAARVSEIKNVKNYFDKGQKAREGIEF